tara:strand:+ start:3185 stop:3622 length:438 start_codon:yes stop_codon:yes gene_type:complete
MIGALFILQALLPATPANVINLGDHLPRIEGERSRCNSKTGFCMTVTLTQFLQLKDIAHNSPNLCRTAVDQAATECALSAAELAVVVSDREQDDAELIRAYDEQNKALKLQLEELNTKRDKLKIGVYSAGAVAVIATSILIVKGL